jgi:hypothetical protein
MGPQGKAKGMKMENVWWVKKHRRLLFEFSEHLPGSHFCSKDPGWDPKGQPQDPKVKMSDWPKNRVKFVVNLIRSHQDITCPARTQDGTPGDNQRDLNWNCRAIEKPYHVFIDFYKVPSWHHFFHSDPGWNPKGQPKGRKGKCLTGKKTRSTFYWILCGPIRASLFPPGSRMGSQGITQGTKSKTSDM